MLWLAIIANIIATAIIPVYATLSDRTGRKPVLLTGTIGCAVTIVAFLWPISTGNGSLIMIIGVLLGGFVCSLTNAVWPATQRFPTRCACPVWLSAPSSGSPSAVRPARGSRSRRRRRHTRLGSARRLALSCTTRLIPT